MHFLPKRPLTLLIGAYPFSMALERAVLIHSCTSPNFAPTIAIPSIQDSRAQKIPGVLTPEKTESNRWVL